MNLFFRKKYPEFWQKYAATFKEKIPSSYQEIRFVIFDTETTGLDFKKDKILSIGAVAVLNSSILVADSFEYFVHQTTFDRKTVEIHGIRKDGNEVKLTEEEALIQFIEYLDNAIIVAHHTKFDVTMLNQALRRVGGGTIRSKQLDTNFIHKKMALTDHYNKNYTLDELCDSYNIIKHDRHTALGDALLTAYLFLKLTYKFRKNNVLNLDDLIKTNYQL